MKGSRVTLMLFAALAIAAPTAAGEEKAAAGLSVAIVTEKDKAGTPTINHRTFRVVFTNRSSKPIRLWSERCRPGYGALSFRVEDTDGVASLMHKRIADLTGMMEYIDLVNKRLNTITIPPGETFAWDVEPSSMVWDAWEWKNAPEANTGRLVTLTDVLSIQPSDAARKHGVWTGRFVSRPVKVLVVDPNLRTPHDYLQWGCPRQALKLIQANRMWMKKVDNNQCTPLHLAASLGFGEVAQWLLANGADLNARAYNDYTPLLYTTHPEIVKLLLTYKADVNAKSGEQNALEQAAGDYAHTERIPGGGARARRLLSIVKMLRDAGAEYGIRSAVYLGDIQRVQVLLTADKKQARDKEAMQQAAIYGRTKIVKLLLQHGADPEDADCFGLTVSYLAIEHPDVLKLLFDAGANPKVRVEYNGNGGRPQSQGSSLLYEAAERGLIESAKLLLARGVDVNQASSIGATALHAACRGGDVALVELLLRNKANARARTARGWTPMGWAAAEIQPEEDEANARYQAVIRALVRGGVEMDIFSAIGCNDVERVTTILQKQPKAGESRNPGGHPALHRAVMLDRREIVKRLLDKGTDPNIRSRGSRGDSIEYVDESALEEKTALFQAAQWGRPEIAAMLIKRGANVNARAANGVVPLHEAARMGHVELGALAPEARSGRQCQGQRGQHAAGLGRLVPRSAPDDQVKRAIAAERSNCGDANGRPSRVPACQVVCRSKFDSGGDWGGVMQRISPSHVDRERQPDHRQQIVTISTSPRLTKVTGLTAGLLTATVTVAGFSSSTVQVATVKPVVSASTTSLPANPPPTVIIHGFGFSSTPSDDVVTLGGVQYTPTTASPTELTLSNVSGLTAGKANLSASATELVIRGVGFSTTPGHNTVTFVGGASGVVTAASGTKLIVAKLKGLTAGVIQAFVTTNGESSATVDMATVT